MRRLFASLLGLVLALGAVLEVAPREALAETEYPLWVGGVQVTSANVEDVLGDADEGATVTFDPASTTLTLDGANITTGHEIEYDYIIHSYGIYYDGSALLTIAVASDSTIDVSEISADTTAGIYCELSELTITGAGKLTAKDGADGEGISGYHNVTIDKGVVVASGGNSGIIAREGDVAINGSTVEVDGGIAGIGVTVNSSTVEVSGLWFGIQGHSVTINDGEVTATVSDGDGIMATATNNEPGSVTIAGGTVSATGGAEGHGIYAQESSGAMAPGTVTIGGGVASVTASGGTKAVEGVVINAVAGMGWTDAAGTTDKAAITTTGEGQELSYKKVQFPTPVAKVATAPAPTNPTYNGKAQELVTEGFAEGGTMWYSLDGTAWSDKVPTGTEAKSYTVWYKAVGDESHGDTEPQSVESTITYVRVNPAYTKPGPLSAPAGSTLGSVALPKADNGVWSWQDPADTSVGEEVGETKTFLAKFTPSDRKRYNTVENVEVAVRITGPVADVSEPDKPTYAVTAGADAEYARGSDSTLTFVFKRSEGDDETFERFKSASVDGRAMTRDRDYTASAGSLVIELQPSFLATLAAGEHTLTATFDDGMAETEFTVAEDPFEAPTMSNSKGGDFASLKDEITFTVTQKVPAEATSLHIWVDLDFPFDLVGDESNVKVTDAYGNPVVAETNLLGRILSVEVADAEPLRGGSLVVTYVARVRDGVDLSEYLNPAGDIASIPYQAHSTFNGDEETVYSSSVEYVKFRVGRASGNGQAPQTNTPTNTQTNTQTNAPTTTANSTLPKTGDPASLVAVVSLATAGAGAVVAGLRRRRKEQ